MNVEQFLHEPHPFLAGLCAAHLRELADAAMETQFAAGQHIFREGDHAHRFYLIEDGKVALQTHSGGHPVPIATLGPGEVLGWSWLFPPYCWHFDAWAEADTRTVAFEATRLRDLCEADKALGYELMKRMAGVLVQRLQSTRLKLAQSRKPDLRATLPIVS